MITYMHAIEGKKGTFLRENPLQKLPLGDILPSEGWLHEQLKLMSEGITGRLPEYGPFFRPERDGFLHPETHAGWEEVPLWLRGFYPLAVLTKNQEHLVLAQKYIEAILNSRDADGWFGPAHLKCFAETESGAPIPDLFPNMLLTDTLLLYYSASKDERVLSLFGAYIRFCLSLDDAQFLPPTEGYLRWQKIRAGDMLEQLYEYYRLTEDSDALTLAHRVYRNIAKSLSGFCATHAVDFAQRFAAHGIYYTQTSEPSYFRKTEYEYEKYKSVYGEMPRGLFAADEQIRIGATDPREGFEPCGMVELAKNFYILGRISGDSKYADRTEDIMLNHFPASFTEDYRQIHYITSANRPILSNTTDAMTYNGSESHDRSYEIFTPNNRCCGHNTGMGWPYYTVNLWQKTLDGGLAAFLYAPSVVNTEIDGQKIALRTETDYPFKETVRVTVLSDGSFPLYFRLPAWCTSCALTVNGEILWDKPQKGGWLRLERAFKTGDVISIAFGMEIALTHWASNGSVSVERGPFTYSVRIAEEYRVLKDAYAYNHPEPHLWENYEVLPRSPWNYGLMIENENPASCISLSECKEELAKQPFSYQNAPVVLKARAKRIPAWNLECDTPAELEMSPVFSDEPCEEIELIPLGCARLRMSCLPIVTENPHATHWKRTPAFTPFEERAPAFPVHYDLTARKDELGGPWDPEKQKKGESF